MDDVLTEDTRGEGSAGAVELTGESVGKAIKLGSSDVPDVWIPDSSIWVDDVDFKLGKDWATNSGSIASSPIVVGVPKAQEGVTGFDKTATWADFLTADKLPVSVQALDSSSSALVAMGIANRSATDHGDRTDLLRSIVRLSRSTLQPDVLASFAVQDADGVSKSGGAVATIFTQALTSKWAGVVLIISTAGQLFCTAACQTSASRMMFAFSRDGAVPGHKLWSRVRSNGMPANAVVATATIAAIITLPALVSVDINGAPVPVAFYAVVSIGVVGLYLCFAVPIYYRWKAGDSFEAGSWTLGSKYKWIAPLALIEIALTSLVAMFPTSLGGMPWDASFEWKYVNYTPLLVGGALILLYVYWHVSVKKWFTGPIKQVDAEPVDA